MKIFVVVDSRGSLVGAFDAKDKAELVLRANPRYYTLYECELNKINIKVANVLQNEEDRKKLRNLLQKHE